MSILIPLLGAAQAIGGILKGHAEEAKAKRLRASRTAFKTSSQIYDIQAATENNASQGYDVGTLDYLTNQIDNAASSAYDTSKKLGGDPNDLSAILDQQLQGILKVGAGSAAVRMENFGKYLGAQELLSKNLDAEWASKQGMIKDDLQAAAQGRQEAAAQVSNGLSNVVSGISSMEIAKLYKERTNAIKKSGATVDLTPPPAQPNFTTQGRTLDASTNLPSDAAPSAVQSVASIVNPDENTFRRGRSKIMAIDENGNLVYGR